MAWILWGTNPGTRKRFFCTPQRLRGPPCLLANWYRTCFLGVKRSGHDVEHHLNTAPRLRMSGAIPLLSLYAFMAWTMSTFLSVALQSNSGLGRLIFEGSRSHTHTRARAHARTVTSPDERSARRDSRYLHNTQQIQETNVYVLRGSRTLNTSHRAAADLYLRPLSHRDRSGQLYLYFIV
jgi:hypothetical protein